MRYLAYPFVVALLSLGACASQEKLAKEARISQEQATRTAESSVGGGAKDTHLERENGRTVYEVDRGPERQYPDGVGRRRNRTDHQDGSVKLVHGAPMRIGVPTRPQPCTHPVALPTTRRFSGVSRRPWERSPASWLIQAASPARIFSCSRRICANPSWMKPKMTIHATKPNATYLA